MRFPRSSPAGEGDDVWSLCVVLYEMVSGKHPFAGGSANQLAAGPGTEPPVIAFAAATLRGARPATVRAFAAALWSAPGNGA